jgi:hypothetical protein
MDVERIQPSDITTLPTSKKRLEQLRVLFITAKAFIIRSPSPPTIESPALDHLNGHHEALPLDLPTCDTTASPEHRRTKPPIPFESLYPRTKPVDELMALQGPTESVAVAERIRERFWTHVVRSLAAESTHGATPTQIQLTRRCYIRSANKKLDANWWISNKDKLT